MAWNEHVPGVGSGVGAGEAGSVTLAAVRAAGGLQLILVVHPAVLRTLPWFRGGVNAAVVLGDYANIGKMRIVRSGPYTLRAQAGRLEKMPPVQVRLPAFGWMGGDPHDAETMAYQIAAGQVLEVRLPSWAAPPVPLSAPVTSFSAVYGSFGYPGTVAEAAEGLS